MEAKKLDRENALTRIDKWYRAMVYACIIFAVRTFFIWAIPISSEDDYVIPESVTDFSWFVQKLL